MFRSKRRAMTLAELLAVSCILVMMAGTMGALAVSVQESGDYQYGQSVSLQHAQVVIQRIQTNMGGATANEAFPGLLVVPEISNGRSYPDTLVIWQSPTPVSDPTVLPKMSELVIYSPNPYSPNELWEIMVPNDHRSAPPPADLEQWRTYVTAIKADPQSRRVTLTNLLRTADADGARRAVLRFVSQLRPSELEWSQYVAGTRTWESVPFVQGIRGSAAGLRQSWCRFEFQLRPFDTDYDGRDAAIPFFGSGAVLYELPRR